MRRLSSTITDVQLFSGFLHGVYRERKTAAPTHEPAPPTFNDALVLITTPPSTDTSTTKLTDFRKIKRSNHMLLNNLVKVQVLLGQFALREKSFPRASCTSSI
jgi:hypothetical protein